MDKIGIEETLRQRMKILHWDWEKVYGLPRAYLRKIPVTPVFIPNVIRRSNFVYQLSGYIGVICLPFEASWNCRTNSSPTGPNNFCLALDIANFDMLRAKQLIKSEDMQRDVDGFCESLANFMELMPHDEQALKVMLQGRVISGIAPEKFVVYGQSEKILALKKYLQIGHAGVA
jgi:hypothetical protein